MNEWLKILQSAWTDLQAGENWQVSHKRNGVLVPGPALQNVALLLDASGPEVAFIFVGRRLSYAAATRRVMRDGQEWVGARVRVSHRWRGLELRLVVEFSGMVAGVEERVRMDATVARLPLGRALRWRLAL